MVVPCAFFALAVATAGAQWLLLRQRLFEIASWPLLTAGGILLGCPFLYGAFFDSANRPDGANALLFALFTLVVGLVQWFGLWRRADRTIWWIAGNAAGGALAWWGAKAVWSVANARDTVFPVRWLVPRHIYATLASGYGEPSAASVAIWLAQGAVAGLIYGIVTGATLLWIVRATSSLTVHDPTAARRASATG